MEPAPEEPVIIVSENSPNINRQVNYRLYLGDHIVQITVTSTPGVVRRWVERVVHYHRRSRRKWVVGLGVQWSNNNPNVAATLQLCVADTCLIFQLQHAGICPAAVRRLLVDPSAIFVGFRNHRYREMLANTEHGLVVRPLLDLQEVANVMRGCRPDASASELASELLGYGWIEMDPQVAMSDWTQMWLSVDQVQYATLDAFLAFLVAMRLQVWRIT